MAVRRCRHARHLEKLIRRLDTRQRRGPWAVSLERGVLEGGICRYANPKESLADAAGRGHLEGILGHADVVCDFWI